MSHGPRRLAQRSLLATQLALAGVDAYLLTLLAAAAARPKTPLTEPADRRPTRFLVLVPAHDEAGQIEACLAAIAHSQYPSEALRVCVIADNCGDDTAAIARAHGAVALERDDALHRGKGYALNWALDRARELAPDHDAVAFVDADCELSPSFFAAAHRALAAGSVAAQARYVVANSDASTTSAVRAAAFLLMASVRPLGRMRLGLSAGLFGTGMAFRADVVQALRFDTSSVVEDGDLHLRLLAGGHSVAFLPDAEVRSPMPTHADAAESQQMRWEGGRGDLIRRRGPAVAVRGVRHAEPAALVGLVELLVPPTSLLALAHLAAGAASAAAGRRGRLAALATNGMFAAFVLGGLRVADAQPEVYRGLRGAPRLAVQKLALMARLARGGAPSSWERTQREGAAA